MNSPRKKKSAKKRAAPAKPKSVPKKSAKKSPKKSSDWTKRFSKEARERIAREGYHLPTRTESEQLEKSTDDVREAWRALRSFLLNLGPQGPVRTSHKAIMFDRARCYAFARPKLRSVELYFFLPRAVESPLLKKVTPTSKTRFEHVYAVTHADHVMEPLTDWLREAYEFAGG